jgi:hypothetical protein
VSENEDGHGGVVPLGRWQGENDQTAGQKKGVTRAETFWSKLCFMNVGTNAMTTGRLGTLGAVLRPENYLLVLFAISTTLWTVAFLFYFLSTQVGAGLAAMARAVHVRRVRA